MQTLCPPPALSTLILALSLPLLAAAAGPKYLPHPVPANAPAAPFSDAVLAGDTLYLAGHLGLDPATGQAAADADAEVRLMLDAVRHTLESGGMRMDDLVSVTVFCTDLSLYDRFNTIYRGYFRANYPARAFIGVDKLVRGARFELQGIAVRSRGVSR
ncbi:MAG TPA: RidA family protein [Steroidobacteraceae bacterium]|nr:RidA family protein [Steroidobacteraceae bacterium]